MQDETIPFDLFPDEWDRVLAAVLSQQPYFNSSSPISESVLQYAASPKADADTAVHTLMNDGFLERGRGGYRIGLQAEVFLRVIGVLLRTIGMPGSTSRRQG